MRLRIILIVVGLLVLGSGSLVAANTIFKPKPPKPTQFIGFENVSKDFPSELKEKNQGSTSKLCAEANKDSLTYEALCKEGGEAKGVQTNSFNSPSSSGINSESRNNSNSSSFSLSSPSNPSSPYTSNPQTSNPPTQSSLYLTNFNTAISDGNNAANALKPIINTTSSYKSQYSAASASCGARGLRPCHEAEAIFQTYKNSVKNSLKTAIGQLQLADIYIKGSRPYPAQWQTPFSWLEFGLSSLAEAILTTQNLLDSGSWADTSSLNSRIQEWNSSVNSAKSAKP